MKISFLALATLVAATPVTDLEHRAHSHHHVKVSRFAVPDCQPQSHIEKDVTVEQGDCKNFLGKEPGFISFKAKITYNRKGRLGSSEECRLYAYEEKDCKGKKQAMDDISKYNGACQNQDKVFGRSVYLKCMKKSDLDVADDFDAEGQKPGGIPGARPASTSNAKVFEAATISLHTDEPTPTPVVVLKTQTLGGNSLTRVTLGMPTDKAQSIKWKTMTALLDVPSRTVIVKATATVTNSLK